MTAVQIRQPDDVMGVTFVVLLTLLSITRTGSEVVARSEFEAGDMEQKGCDPQLLPEGVGIVPAQEHYGIGENVTYACANDNLTLIGAVVSFCNENNSWSDSPPLCLEAACEIQALANGNVSATSNVTTGLLLYVTYFCRAGYELVGRDTLACDADNGTWDGDVPRCLETCGDAYTPDNGRAVTDCTYENCTARFSCREGYRLRGDTASVCASSVWEHTTALPNCTAITCGAAPLVDHAHAAFEPRVAEDSATYPYKTVVKYVCADNNSLVGDADVYCSARGEWEGQLPQCLYTEEDSANDTHDNYTDRQCPAPSIAHGSAKQSGRQVEYWCYQGYHLSGPSNRQCLENGTWSEQDPVCLLDHRNSGSVPDLSSSWKQVFLSNPHWLGSYRYWDKSVRFQLFVVAHQDTHTNHLELLFDDYEARLYLSVTYRDKMFTFRKTRLFTHSERFLPGRNWSFTGHMIKEANQWRLYSSHFNESAFSQLQMSPRHDGSRIPTLTSLEGGDGQKNATPLALGVVLALLLVAVAALLAAYFVKRHVMKTGGGHHAITSFENPVYDCENALKDADREGEGDGARE